MTTDDFTNATIRARLAAMFPPAGAVATGEPCRCPDDALDCLCGAYQQTPEEVAR